MRSAWGAGALCKRERPLERTSDIENSFLEQYFGSCCARQRKQERFSAVKKNKSRFLLQAEGFALSTPTNPFLKGLIPKSMNLFQEKVSTHAGVWAVFKPRGGCLKISVAPTDKPLKRLDLNFLASFTKSIGFRQTFPFPCGILESAPEKRRWQDAR